MIVISLQSGSNGNCIYVESGETRLLFDAGISAACAATRLAAFGRDIRSVRALILSHDHSDHIRGAGALHRKFGLPLYISPGTLDAAARRRLLGQLKDVHTFRPGETFRVGDAAVETVPTPHDAAQGSAFVVEAEGRRLGILTDLGCVFDELPGVIGSLDAVLLESNYDPHMLAQGPYPDDLKERIRGPGGHLSNAEAARLLHDAAKPALRWACLSHLSEQNNTPRLALRTHRKELGDALPLLTASRYEALAMPEIR